MNGNRAGPEVDGCSGSFLGCRQTCKGGHVQNANMDRRAARQHGKLWFEALIARFDLLRGLDKRHHQNLDYGRPSNGALRGKFAGASLYRNNAANFGTCGGNVFHAMLIMSMHVHCTHKQHGQIASLE